MNRLVPVFPQNNFAVSPGGVLNSLLFSAIAKLRRACVEHHGDAGVLCMASEPQRKKHPPPPKKKKKENQPPPNRNHSRLFSV